MKRRFAWLVFGVGLLALLAPMFGASASSAAYVLQPEDLHYLGAFRLPQGGERPYTFAYGGNAMTFIPTGDPQGAGDGFAGSLLITGHDRLAYGELPDGSRVAEVSIPAPVIAASVEQLPRAELLQDFSEVTGRLFAGLDEMPRIGMAYLDTAATGPKVHWTWSTHLIDAPHPTQAWFDPDLSAPNMQGPWYVGDFSPYSVSGYLFTIPQDWADAHTEGRPLATGRFRDGGWSGMGPSLIAYRPWNADGSPPPAGARLEATALLLYDSSEDGENFAHALRGYQHPDEWEGGAWLTTPDGGAAVIFVGTKATGSKYWYGYPNPAGADVPCVAAEVIGEMIPCRLADETPCPPEDLTECADHNDYRGWWSTDYVAQFLFYDPDELAQVAAGTLAPWQPQPYATLDVDEHLFLPEGVEPDMIGAGRQRHYRLGAAAFDRASGRLYVLELFADDAAPVVHVWQVGAAR